MQKSVKPTRKISYSRIPKTNITRSISLSGLFKDLKKYKKLTQKQTNQLILAYNTGEEEEKEEAFNLICKHNILLVVSIAKAYCSNDDNLDDLIQEGNIGLMKAVEMFDIRYGVPFQNYASFWIRRYINMFKINLTPIVSQPNKAKTFNAIQNIKNEFYQKFERNPTETEVFEEYNKKFPNNKIVNISDVENVEYVFIDHFGNNDTNDPSSLSTQKNKLYDTVSSSHNLFDDYEDKESKKEIVRVLVNCLSEKEKIVINKVFGLNGQEETTLANIATCMGYTEQRISQLYHSAINKMKEYNKMHSVSISK